MTRQNKIDKPKLHWAERLLQISFVAWGLYLIYLLLNAPPILYGIFLAFLTELFPVGVLMFLFFLGFVYYTFYCFKMAWKIQKRKDIDNPFIVFMFTSLVVSLFMLVLVVDVLFGQENFNFQVYFLPLLWTLLTIMLKWLCPKAEKP